MIHRIHNMIGSADTAAQITRRDGDLAWAAWVWAVPCPFRGGLFDRLADAWAVLTERAYAVRWPQPGELEDAVAPLKLQACRVSTNTGSVAPGSQTHD